MEENKILLELQQKAKNLNKLLEENNIDLQYGVFLSDESIEDEFDISYKDSHTIMGCIDDLCICQNKEYIEDTLYILEHAITVFSEHKIQQRDGFVNDTQVAFHWSIEDITSRASDNGLEITEEQAKNILQAMVNNHDAEIGINWDIIDIYLNDKNFVDIIE